MRAAVTLSLATAVSLLSVTSDALNLAKRSGSAPAVVTFEIERKHVANPAKRDQTRRRKRQENIVVQELDNEVCRNNGHSGDRRALLAFGFYKMG
jgi:hypothetical protein